METPGLIASDVDGTLLGVGGQASPRTVGVLARAVAAGVPFVLVTGRPPRWMAEVVDTIGLAGLAVCANGAVVYDTAQDAVLHTETIDPLRLADAAAALRVALPGCWLAVERVRGRTVEDTLFLSEPGFRSAWPHSDHITVQPAELVGHPAVKLLARHPGMTSDAMAEAACAVLGDASHITFSTGNGLIELSAPGVTKGSGLCAVAARFGVPADAVIAFGDMPNDLPMLAWAGYGVAVANAHPSVLAAADEITAANTEDGVAAVLERWF